MDERFIRTKLALEEIRELGYTEVWIGSVSNPHWPEALDSFVIACPKRRVANYPAIWSVSERNFGPMSCGNGLRQADQCQRELVRKFLPGHYVLRDGCWFPEET
jgi:hypothetical protein